MDYEVWLDKNRESLSPYIYAKMHKNIYLKEGDGEMANGNCEWVKFGRAKDGTGHASGVEMEFYISSPILPQPLPEKVLFNNKATILFWSDGTKTVSVCKDGDTYNQETGVLNCIAQKYVKQLNKKVGKLLKEARVEWNE